MQYLLITDRADRLVGDRRIPIPNETDPITRFRGMANPVPPDVNMHCEYFQVIFSSTNRLSTRPGGTLPLPVTHQSCQRHHRRARLKIRSTCTGAPPGLLLLPCPLHRPPPPR